MNKKNTKFIISGNVKNVVVGNKVKIAIIDENYFLNESFWTIITDIKDDKLYATVDNDLIYTDKHGYKYLDKISFSLDNVLMVL